MDGGERLSAPVSKDDGSERQHPSRLRRLRPRLFLLVSTLLRSSSGPSYIHAAGTPQYTLASCHPACPVRLLAPTPPGAVMRGEASSGAYRRGQIRHKRDESVNYSDNFENLKSVSASLSK